jgi:glycine cleavage system aminomethyltransferase T
LDSLRIEKGYRYFGIDITPSDTPYDAGLGFCVDLENGDFVGRNALVLARDDDSRPRLRTVVVGDEEYVTIYGGEAVHAGGRVVARLRSCAYGYTVRRNVAFAYLPREMGPGTRVDVEVFGQLIPAHVSNDVLYDPERTRVAA